MRKIGLIFASNVKPLNYGVEQARKRMKFYIFGIICLVNLTKESYALEETSSKTPSTSASFKGNLYIFHSCCTSTSLFHISFFFQRDVKCCVVFIVVVLAVVRQKSLNTLTPGLIRKINRPPIFSLRSLYLRRRNYHFLKENEFSLVGRGWLPTKGFNIGIVFVRKKTPAANCLCLLIFSAIFSSVFMTFVKAKSCL